MKSEGEGDVAMSGPLTTPGGVPLSEHGQTGLMRDVLQFMVEREAEHHEAGWDETPMALYRVCRDRTGYDVEQCRLGVQENHPRDELAQCAMALEATVPDWVARLLYPSYPVAHFVVSEAWAHHVDIDKAEEWDRERRGRGLADIVGSYEVRIALALIGHPGRTLQILRRRGTEPMLTTDFDLITSDPSGIYQSLCRLHTAAWRLYRTRGRR